MAAKQELYFRVKVGLRDSDGAGILARRLEDPRAYTYVPDLWDWFVQKHPEGQIVGPDAAFLVARGCGWQGEADRFCAAMVAAGFLAVIPEGFRVKGWKEWAGFHLEVRAAERTKKRAQRSDPEGQGEGSPRDVPGTSPGQGIEKTASEGPRPGDTSYISSLSVSSASEGVQGEARPRPRARLVSPYGASDPHPEITAVLAALWGRGLDAAPPADRSAGRVKAAIVEATIPVAVERLAAVYADPGAKKPLTYHVDAIRGAAPRRQTHGDLGSEFTPWNQRLTPEQHRAATEELRALAALDPELECAPLGIPGDPGSPAYAEIQRLNEKWRAVAEGA